MPQQGHTVGAWDRWPPLGISSLSSSIVHYRQPIEAALRRFKKLLERSGLTRSFATANTREALRPRATEAGAGFSSTGTTRALTGESGRAARPAPPHAKAAGAGFSSTENAAVSLACLGESVQARAA